MSNIRDIIKRVNRSNTLPLEQRSVLRGVLRELESTIELVASTIDSNYDYNQRLSGGDVAWVTGLTFSVSPAKIMVDGTVYETDAATVTLSDGDGTHPRKDVIAANIDGTIDVVEGTPAASPAEPDVDPNTQVLLTVIDVAQSATTPSNVGNTVIYDEDDNWTSAVVGNVNAADTSDPRTGTKAIKFTAADNGDRVTLTAAATVNPAEVDRFAFYIKNGQQNTNTRNRLAFRLYNGTTAVSSWVNLRHGDFGYDGNNTSTYQFIHMPFGQFRSTGDEFDTIRIQVLAASGQVLTFLLDDIVYQVGVPNVDTSDFATLSNYNVWRSAQGSPIVTLTDGATVTCDLKQANVFELTLGGNRTIDFTNPTAGQHFTLFLKQDGTGSRTVTWDAAVDWAGGTAPTLATGADAVDVLSFAVDGDGNIHGTLGIADSQ